MPLKIVLIDDQALIRAGIKSLLSLSDRVEVIGEAADGQQGIAVIQQLQPDLVLLDLSMPVMDGIQTLGALKQLELQVPVIILTTFDDHELVLRGIHAGAKGYLLKDVSLESLIEAIETVAQGNTLIQPAITERLLAGLKNKNSNKEFAVQGQVESLTAKELEILRLMASGYSNKEISSAFHKSEGTIKNHVSNILAKLGVRDRTRAVLLAIEKGIL